MNVRAVIAGVTGFGLIACALLHPADPASYAKDLTACETHANSWAEYAPCCADVARKYGRSPTFCYPAADSGVPDGQ